MIKELKIASIKRDLTLQPRTALHQDWVEEYAHDMLGGANMPPVVVFFDGEENWLADGFHRVYAAEAAGLSTIAADVSDGSRLDALRFSCGANATHGQRRNGDDMRRAYKIAVGNQFVEATDAAAVAELLHCSVQWARVLTKQARDEAEAERNAEITRLKSEGNSNREIARRTGLPPRTVDRAVVAPKGNSFALTQGNGALSKPHVEPFDWDAANVRNRAMDAIRVLAKMPAPSEVIDAWMKTQGYGEPIETLEAAADWLAEFTDLYRDAEPKRWARIEKAAEKTREREHAAQQHH